MDVAVDQGNTSYLADFEHLNAQLQEHEERLRVGVDRAARYHAGIKDASASIGDQFEEVRRQLAVLRDKHDRADGLLAEAKAALMLLHERLRQVESFTTEAPMLRADLEEKIHEVRDLGRRLQTIDEGVSATVERIGGAEGFEALHAIPQRIRVEAEQAREELSKIASRLSRQMQEQLAAVSDPGVREVGEAVNRILEAGQRQLEMIEAVVADAASNLAAERQTQIDQQQAAWQQLIESTRAEAVDLRAEVATQVERCRQTIDEATGAIERKFERWLGESVQDVLQPELEAWRGEVHKGLEDAEAQRAMDRISANARLNQMERGHKKSVSSLRRWVLGLGFVTVVLLSVLVLLVLERGDAEPRPRAVLQTTREVAPVLQEESYVDAEPVATGEPVDVEPLPVHAERSDLAPAPPANAEDMQGDASNPGTAPFPRLTWVVASTTDRAEAETFSNRLRASGQDAHVFEAFVAGALRYRVTLGSFDSVDRARAARSELGLALPDDAWILEVSPDMGDVGLSDGE